MPLKSITLTPPPLSGRGVGNIDTSKFSIEVGVFNLNI
jgi:hypothetical protein